MNCEFCEIPLFGDWGHWHCMDLLGQHYKESPMVCAECARRWDILQVLREDTPEHQMCVLYLPPLDRTAWNKALENFIPNSKQIKRILDRHYGRE